MAELPPILVELKANAGSFLSSLGAARREVKNLGDSSTHVHRFGVIAGAAFAAAGVGAIAAGYSAVKAAGDFQQGMTTLVTGAGETKANLGKVSSGILDLATKTGESTQQLTDGLYMVESAGYHGAQGLNVLQAAAEGAKVGNADLGTMADAVTSALNAYKLPASSAVDVTDALVKTVASGKMHMQDLAGSLGAILPAASTANVGLSEVLGAIATMTAQGTPAADATTYLRQTILQLSNPSAKAAMEMKALGLNAIDVSKGLGTRGLAGTLTLLTDAIQKKMGPGGTVLIEQLKKSAKSTTQFQKVLANLPPVQQTFISALANMVGGTKSMQAALELTGGNMTTFTSNTAAIDKAAQSASKHVDGWSDVQKDLNFKLQRAHEQAEVLKIKLGNALFPVVYKLTSFLSSTVIPDLTTFGHWINQNRQWLVPLVTVLGTLIGTFYATVKVIALVNTVMKLFGAESLITAGPVGVIIAAIAGLVVAGYEVYRHWSQIWPAMGHVVGEFVSLFMHYIRTEVDFFFTFIDSILKAASHLPFVGHYFKSAYNAVHGFKESVDSTLNGIADSALNWGRSAGSNLGYGLAAGVATATPAARAAAQSLASAAHISLNNALRISSPSKAAMESGAFFGEGFALGILQHLPTATRAAAHLGRGALGGFGGRGEFAGVGRGRGLSVHFEPKVVVVVDGREVHAATKIEDRRYRMRNNKSAFS